MTNNPLWGSQKRPPFSIVADVLEIAGKGALKTTIMYQANLNYSQANKYLSLLLDLNLLEVVKASEKIAYKTTDKGLRYLQRYREIVELLKEGKGNNPREANLLHLIECGSRVIIAR